MQRDGAAPIKLFYSYSHKDEALRNELADHLFPLQRAELIEVWHDREMLPGDTVDEEIARKLRSADLVLVLVSPSFIQSEYCWDIELAKAIKRHERGEARVVPVVLRPCQWQLTPLKDLLVMPTDGRAVTDWPNRDNAFNDVAKGIARLATAMRQKGSKAADPAAAGAKPAAARVDAAGGSTPPLPRPAPQGVKMDFEELYERLWRGGVSRGQNNVDADQSEAQYQIEHVEDPAKRRLVKGLLRTAAVGVVAVLGDIAYNTWQSVTGEVGLAALKKFVDHVAPDDLTIRPGFVVLANRERGKQQRELLDVIVQELGNPTPVEAACIRALGRLNDGGLVSPSDYTDIRHAAAKNEQGNTAAFVRTLLAAHLVRIGCTDEAGELIDLIDIGELAPEFKLLTIERKLSIHYVGLASSDALDTSRWKYGDALKAFRNTSPEFDIVISDDPQPIIDLPENRITRHGIEAARARDVQGFYLMFFSLLYWAANQKPDNLQDAGDLIWHALRELALEPKFERAVWNAGFIAALQFHRQGEFKQRDRLLRICLGDSHFWRSRQPANRWGPSLKATDIMPIAAAHFMRSTPRLIDRLRVGGLVPSSAHISGLASQMAPSSLLQSVDIIRKVAEEGLSPAGLFLRHGIHQGGLGIYHEPAKAVRAGLLAD